MEKGIDQRLDHQKPIKTINVQDDLRGKWKGNLKRNERVKAIKVFFMTNYVFAHRALATIAKANVMPFVNILRIITGPWINASLYFCLVDGSFVYFLGLNSPTECA